MARSAPGRTGRQRRRRSAGATSWPGSRMTVLYDRSVDLGRPGRRHRQQDRVADRLHDALRRRGERASTRSATCTRARSASSPRPSACPRRSSARRPRPTCGRARPTRPRSASPTPSSTGSCSGWSTGAARPRSSRPRASPGSGSSGRCGWSPASEFKRQVAADRQARPAHDRRRLPLPAAAARLGPDLGAGPCQRRQAGCSSSRRRSATWPT